MYSSIDKMLKKGIVNQVFSYCVINRLDRNCIIVATVSYGQEKNTMIIMQ